MRKIFGAIALVVCLLAVSGGFNLARAGYICSNWTGPAANPNAASTTIMMNGPQTLNANFISALSVTPAAINFGTVYLGNVSNASVVATNKGTTPITFNNA